MNILKKIVADKKIELVETKAKTSIAELEKTAGFTRTCLPVKEPILESNYPRVIAEHKRKSPSKGIINDKVTVEDVVTQYSNAGAVCLSVLTNEPYFMGYPEDVIKARAVVQTPILRKEFMVDEYQVVEAKSIGADMILLIAACLSKSECKQLAELANKLGMQVLLEVHNEEELGHINPFVDLVGVNNRNLKTFEVSIQTSLDIVDKIPDEFAKISESGISAIAPIKELYSAGYKGFLIGENFMKSENPGLACADFLAQLKV